MPDSDIVARLLQAADEERDCALEQDYWHEDLLRDAAYCILNLREHSGNRKTDGKTAIQVAEK